MFRSVKDYETKAEPPLTDAEKDLIAACRAGLPCTVNNGEVPPEDNKNQAITVRAELLRLLIMGGTPACGLQEQGVWLKGARVTGVLDFNFVRAKGLIVMENGRFDERPQMIQADFLQLSFQGSHLPGLFAQGIKVEGSVFLRGVKAKGTVDFNSAKIGGQLDLDKAELDGGTDEVGNAIRSLYAQSAKIEGGVFLRWVKAKGAVVVIGAQIGGQLSFMNAELDGGKNEDGDALEALNAQGVHVTNGFLFRELKKVSGAVDLTSAYVSVLVDDTASWQKCKGDLLLDGFTYDLIGGNSAAKTFIGRKAWLEKGSWIGGEFRPQPYTQLAKVFRAAGHAGEARKVLMERDRLLANVNRKVTSRRDFAAFPFRYGWDFLVRNLTGYGFAPRRTLIAILCLLAITGVVAQKTWQDGSFAPNSDVILVSDGWQDLLLKDCLPEIISACVSNPAEVWSNDDRNGLDWDSFNAIGYAADLVIPVLDLGQTSAWAPSKDRGPWGWGLWWGRWVLEALGWLVTALGAAAVTGLIQRSNSD